jgi:protein SCO1/2
MSTTSPVPRPAGRREPLWLWGVLVVALLALGAAVILRGQRARLLGGGADTSAAVAGRIAAGAAEAIADYGAVPEFALVSQTGDSVRLADLRGQVWIADFFFTHCASSCPMMSARLERLSENLDPRAHIVSFSVDPERDTPARLAEYARNYAVEPGRWLFLTGDKPQIRRLVQEGFHLAVDDATPQDIAAGAEAVLHSTRFVLVDGRGRIRGYYDGTDEAAVARLGRDLERIAGMNP